MQKKLRDLLVAAADAGVRDLDPLPLTSITKGERSGPVLTPAYSAGCTILEGQELLDADNLPRVAFRAVGEFKQLATWAEQEGKRCDSVKKMLKLTKGWEEARDHALKVGPLMMRQLQKSAPWRGGAVALLRPGLACFGGSVHSFQAESLTDTVVFYKPRCSDMNRVQAVVDDGRMRVWFADDTRAHGLLFACEAACPQLDAPAALLQAAVGPAGEATLRASPLHGRPAADVQALLHAARQCWEQRGHPGWAILEVETARFRESCAHLPSALLPASMVAACVPAVPHGSEGMAITRSALLPPAPPLSGMSLAAGGIPSRVAQLAVQVRLAVRRSFWRAFLLNRPLLLARLWK